MPFCQKHCMMLDSSHEWNTLQLLAGHIHERIHHFIIKPLQTEVRTWQLQCPGFIPLQQLSHLQQVNIQAPFWPADD